MSERRACRVVGQCRATQQYVPSQTADEDRLRNRIIALAHEYGRYGYRRIIALLHQEGWQVNHKRVERIWRQEGLRGKERGRESFLDVMSSVHRPAQAAMAKWSPTDCQTLVAPYPGRLVVRPIMMPFLSSPTGISGLHCVLDASNLGLACMVGLLCRIV